MKNSNDFIFPQSLTSDSLTQSAGGLTKREHFALEIYKANAGWIHIEGAVRNANVLLQALNKTEAEIEEES
jgi:hypothetical protein